MTRYLLTILIVSFFIKVTGQTVTVSGYVYDAKTKEKLIGASIEERTSGKITISNSYGYYSMILDATDTLVFIVKYLGYKTRTDTIYPGSLPVLKNFYLLSDTNNLPEIVVRSKHALDNNVGEIRIEPKDVELVPSLGGEQDMFKVFQLMPGIMQGNEGQSGLYVRGSSPDQNLILLDDVPLYYVGHLGGFLSVFNPDAINYIKLIKGEMPAHYGGRLASVVDIRTKDGDMNNFHGSVTAGIVSSKLELDGPIIKNKLSFLVSARRTWLDLVVSPVLKILGSENIMTYSFYDINAKLRYRPGNRDNFFLSFYRGIDDVETTFRQLYNENKNSQLWGNTAFSLRWNHIYNSNKLFSSLILSSGNFVYSNKREANVQSDTMDFSVSDANSFLSGIYDYRFLWKFEYNYTKFLRFNYGFDMLHHIYKPSEITFFSKFNNNVLLDTSYLSANYSSDEYAVYLESIWSLQNKVNLNAGLRASFYQINDTSFVSYEPRLLLSIVLSDKSVLKFSYVKMQQNLHMLSFTSSGMYSNLWVPATKLAIPEKAWMLSLGVEEELPHNLSLQIDAYYKKTKDLIDFGYGSFWYSAAIWETKSEKQGNGTCYGIELFVKKNTGKIYGWTALTYSRSLRQFANINMGKVYPYDYDRPIDLKIFITYKLRENINLSANWVFQSPRPVNIPVGAIPFLEYTQFVANDSMIVEQAKLSEFFYEKNSLRIKPYHRLDVALTFEKQKKHFTREWTISVYNLYNRQNAYFYYFGLELQPDRTYVQKLYQQSLFPIIPSVSYSLRF